MITRISSELINSGSIDVFIRPAFNNIRRKYIRVFVRDMWGNLYGDLIHNFSEFSKSCTSNYIYI